MVGEAGRARIKVWSTLPGSNDQDSYTVSNGAALPVLPAEERARA
jgi:hypothetical protein